MLESMRIASWVLPKWNAELIISLGNVSVNIENITECSGLDERDGVSKVNLSWSAERSPWLQAFLFDDAKLFDKVKMEVTGLAYQAGAPGTLFVADSRLRYQDLLHSHNRSNLLHLLWIACGVCPHSCSLCILSPEFCDSFGWCNILGEPGYHVIK